MADTIKLADGSIHVVFDLNGFMELVDAHLGDEACSWLEEYLAEHEDNDEYIDECVKGNPYSHLYGSGQQQHNY